MRVRFGSWGVLILACAALRAAGQQPGAATPAIDPKADAVLKAMSRALASAGAFSFDSHALTQHVLDDGQKVEFARNTKLAARRPDRITADVIGDAEELAFRYDGKTVAVLNKKSNSYGTADAKATIDDTCDMLAGQYGMVLPLADLLFADPYKTLTSGVRSGRHLGDGFVFDVKCHHLAFRNEVVDWQIWVEQGERPLPRKIVITYKDSPAQLQFTAFLNNWDLSANLPDDRFTFRAPEGAKKVDFARPATVPDAPRQP